MQAKKYLPPLPKAFGLEKRMLHMLMFRSDFLKNPGLLSGKMGIILFFAHYYKISSEDIYDRIADELMEQVLEGVHKELPVGLASGLCGVGWGIEYLIQNGLMEGDSIEICDEIDNKIMEKDPRRMKDLSLENGLEGVLHYVLAHIYGAVKGLGKMPFDEVYLADLYCALDAWRKKTGIPDNLAELIDRYLGFYEGGKDVEYKTTILPFIDQVDMDEKNLITYPLGLQNGIAGVLFKSIMK